MSQKREVVLVDKDDKVLGYLDIRLAHTYPPVLHRAISIVIFSPDKKQMILQKRGHEKPTWPMFWSNTVCTHPRRGESYQQTAERRLLEEMGFSVALTEQFDFIYEAVMDDGKFAEHELDHVFTGRVPVGTRVTPNSYEVEDWRWMDVDKLLVDVNKKPEAYTPWFKIILTKLGY